MKTLILIGSASLCIAGCTTTLSTDHVSSNRAAVSGVLYNLPMAAFDVEAKFLIIGCRNSEGLATVSYELVGGTVQHKLVPDPTETYNIRYDVLNSPTKITSATVTLHPNGMLKSINADIDDRTAQVMASAANVAINLFKAASIGAAPASGAVTTPCDPVIAARLDERDRLYAGLPDAKAADATFDADTDAADEQATKLQVAATKLAEAKKNNDAAAAIKLQSEVEAFTAAWTVANRKIAGKSRKFPRMQARLGTLTAELTATAHEFNWAPSGPGDPVCHAVTLNQAAFLRQLASANGASIKTLPPANTVFEAKACVSGIHSARRAPAAVDAPELAAETRLDGLVYRLPAIASITLESVTGLGKMQATSTVAVPQFGAKGIVWLRNKPFDNNSVQAAFNEDGSMSQLSFKAASQAERGALAFSDTSKSLVELMQLRADATKAKAQAATDEQKTEQQKQLDALDFQIALLSKRKNLDTSRATTRDALDKEKDMLQKQIDVETLRQQYEALKKKALPL